MHACTVSNTLLCVTLSMAAARPARAVTFYEHYGYVVVEAESVPPGQNWVLRSGDYVIKGANTVSGYTGAGCYQFMGNSESGGSVSGTMTYYLSIRTPGTYRVWMRVMEAPVESGAGDVGNDCYIRMVGQNGCLGSYTKYVVLDESYRWSWNVRLECSTHTFSDAVYDLAAGTYQFQVAGRSKYFIIDRFVLIQAGTVLNPADPDVPQSPTDPGTVPLPYTVHDMRGLDFPYAGSGFVQQNLWISLDPALTTRQATVARAFPFLSGQYHVRLYCVAENTGSSTYRLWAGERLLGTYQAPLSARTTELGTHVRGAWDSVQVDSAESIRVEATAGTLDNVTWTRAGWQKVSFVPLFDPAQTPAVPSGRRPLGASGSPAFSRRCYTVDGRRWPGQPNARPIGPGVVIGKSGGRRVTLETH